MIKILLTAILMSVLAPSFGQHEGTPNDTTVAQGEMFIVVDKMPSSQGDCQNFIHTSNVNSNVQPSTMAHIKRYLLNLSLTQQAMCEREL